MAHNHDHRACTDYNSCAVTRRDFLGTSAAAAAAVASAPAWLPRIAYAKDQVSPRDIVVSIYLFGAFDGLSVLVPYGDSNYYDPTKRPDIAVQPPDASVAQSARCHELAGTGSFWGLSDPLFPLLDAYTQGDLLLTHATGSLSTSRSHFDARRFMEVGKDDQNLASGWLSRHLASTPPMDPSAILRAVSVNTGLAQTLAPAIQSMPVPNLTNFGLTGAGSSETARINKLVELYACAAGDKEPMDVIASNTQMTIDLLEQVDFTTYCDGTVGADYDPEANNNSFARSLRSIAALIKADVGVEAAHYEYGGWDTHQEQDNLVQGGFLNQRLRDVANALAGFHADMDGCGLDNVTLVLISEFGRTFDQNDNLGTDHGSGNVMMAMGKHINGGQVLTTSDTGPWTAANSYLAPSELDSSGDLRVTLDYRDILREIVRDRLCNPNYLDVFDNIDPSYVPTDYGVAQA